MENNYLSRSITSIFPLFYFSKIFGWVYLSTHGRWDLQTKEILTPWLLISSLYSDSSVSDFYYWCCLTADTDSQCSSPPPHVSFQISIYCSFLSYLNVISVFYLAPILLADHILFPLTVSCDTSVILYLAKHNNSRLFVTNHSFIPPFPLSWERIYWQICGRMSKTHSSFICISCTTNSHSNCVHRYWNLIELENL